MKLIIQNPKQALKSLLRQAVLRADFDAFKKNLINLLDKINIIENQPADETEEHLKNNIRDFLRDTYYKNTNSEIAVIIEAKRPSNTEQMISTENINKKALHELILYYFDERKRLGNFQLKHLIITNIHEWYIFDENDFDKYIYNNSNIKKLYEIKINDKKTNEWFYAELKNNIINNIDLEILCTYFDLREYKNYLQDNTQEKQLISLFKIFSPEYLLKVSDNTDSNDLDNGFYLELLHILGLEEINNKICRKKDNRDMASFIELTIDAICTENILYSLTSKFDHGENDEEIIFSIALELSLTWINRILFLKLLEGQLVNYHCNNKEFAFLNTQTIADFNELFNLFHKVIAVDIQDRSETLKEKYEYVPYLNSSLFEISIGELEDQTLTVKSLDSSAKLKLFNNTILKNTRQITNNLNTLDYLFRFLDSYNFASEGKEEIQEERKTLINASVLGKIFEKINGYQDGSVFTPAFITMYMCSESIKKVIVQKFNEVLSNNKEPNIFDKFEDIKNYTAKLFKTEDIKKVNEIVNSIKICDPAVGSGHLLVSVLNELIAIKSELGILADDKGNNLGNYEIEIIDDELIIVDRKQRNNTLEYKIENGKPIAKEIQRLQKTIFHEKQTIIENCLFGVDINPKSVLICRLRLWIELLKNTYYKEESNYKELQTLPNLDINIKCGNSLINRFDLKDTLYVAGHKDIVNNLLDLTKQYRKETNKHEKAKLNNEIKAYKKILQNAFLEKNEDYRELLNLQTKNLGLLPEKQKIKVETKIRELENQLKNPRLRPFEWRFEFPEVLDENGNFIGFNLIIGNPPYGINLSKEQKQYFQKNYISAMSGNGFKGSTDTYSLFIEKAMQLVNYGFIHFIVSMSITSSESISQLHNLIFKNCEKVQISSYSNRPNKIFGKADQRVSIIELEKNNKPIQQLKTTKINKRYATTKPEKIMNNLEFVNSLEFIQYGRLPKIGKEIEKKYSLNYLHYPKN